MVGGGTNVLPLTLHAANPDGLLVAAADERLGSFGEGQEVVRVAPSRRPDRVSPVDRDELVGRVLANGLEQSVTKVGRTRSESTRLLATSDPTMSATVVAATSPPAHTDSAASRSNPSTKTARRRSVARSGSLNKS